MSLTIDLGSGEASANSTELETALYRITQEALTNARKHGGARRALIDLHAMDHCVHLTVRDDGHGFDPDAKTNGFGLHSMRERAELLGGTLKINSASAQAPRSPPTFRRAPLADGAHPEVTATTHVTLERCAIAPHSHGLKRTGAGFRERIWEGRHDRLG